MQLRKVCNHPDLFEVRPIVTSFAMERSAVADFEIKELLVRRQFLNDEGDGALNLSVLGLRFVDQQNKPIIPALESRRLDATLRLPFISEIPGGPPPKDTRTIVGFKRYAAHCSRAETISRWSHIGYLNHLRCNSLPIYSREMITAVKQLYNPLVPGSVPYPRSHHLSHGDLVNSSIRSYPARAADMSDLIDKFAFVTPAVVARDMPRISLDGNEAIVLKTLQDTQFDAVTHRASVKLQIAFPDPSLLQYDCGKLQGLSRLLREKKMGGHRVLIFTQMTKILDILEIFLNFMVTFTFDWMERRKLRIVSTSRNDSTQIPGYSASSRLRGLAELALSIYRLCLAMHNFLLIFFFCSLTGADTVVFYDSEFNPQMDRQCEDRYVL
jgi:helicase SWR1